MLSPYPRAILVGELSMYLDDGASPRPHVATVGTAARFFAGDVGARAKWAAESAVPWRGADDLVMLWMVQNGGSLKT